MVSQIKDGIRDMKILLKINQNNKTRVYKL